MLALPVAGLLVLAATAGPPIAQPAPLREQVLVTILSEPEQGLIHELVLFLDGQGLIRRVVRRSSVDSIETTPEDLIRGPVVLARLKGRSAVTLSCPGCDLRTGGTVVLGYVRNGLTGRYGSFVMRIARRPDGLYVLTTPEGRTINRLRMTARRWLGVLIGVGAVRVEG